MAKIVVFPLGNYNGIRTFGPVGIDDGLTRVGFELARCTTLEPTIWPDVSTTIELSVEMSLDGGVEWVSCGGFTAQGGIHVRRDDIEAPVSSYTTWLPAGTNRQARGTLVITNGPLRTSGSVIIE